VPSDPGLLRVRAQREADHSRRHRLQRQHLRHDLIVYREARVDADCADLGGEVERSEAFETIREGGVRVVCEQLAALARFFEVKAGGSSEERPCGEGARAAAARP